MGVSLIIKLSLKISLPENADEDHISLQFREKKGDLVKSENHRKNNNAIAKLVYIYEGIAGITYVLDEFHLEKSITRLTSHMQDSIEDAKKEIYTAIRNKTKEDFKEIISRLEGCLKDESGLKRIKENSDYILENWTAAGCEEDVLSCEAMLREEGKRRRTLGNLANMPIYSIPYPKVKKIANFKDHIYGL